MKALRMLLTAVVVLVAFAYASESQASFEKLKSLEGTWTGKAMGQEVEVSFRVTSAGSAVMSEIRGKEDMITMFHMAGDRLMMTHYCGAGNQPRMLGKMSPDGKTISFDYLDATNLLPEQPGHMQHLVITIPDADHHTESWEFLGADGKTHQNEVFELQRAK